VSLIGAVLVNPLDTGDMFSLEFMNPDVTLRTGKDGPRWRIHADITQDDALMFANANLKGMVLEFQGRVTAAHTDNPDPKPDRPKPHKSMGGPISKACAMLCMDEKANEYAVILGHNSFKNLVYARCVIRSRAELDHDADAAREYELLKSEFIRWAF